jgi:hypothetical protein
MQNAPMIHRLAVASALLFTLFLAGIVYLADSGKPCVFFDLAASLSYGDKLGHFLLMGFFALVANLAFKLRAFRMGPVLIPYGAILVFGVVLIEELSQSFFPTRTCDLSDLSADLAGIIASSILLYGPLSRLIGFHRT